MAVSISACVGSLPARKMCQRCCGLRQENCAVTSTQILCYWVQQECGWTLQDMVTERGERTFSQSKSPTTSAGNRLQLHHGRFTTVRRPRRFLNCGSECNSMPRGATQGTAGELRTQLAATTAPAKTLSEDLPGNP